MNEPFDLNKVAKTKQVPVGPINLTQANAGLRKLIVGVGWDFLPYDGEPLDIDLSCFILGRDGMTREDTDFVFYNNQQGAALAVKHLGDNRTGAGDGDNEAIMVDMDNLSFDVWRIVFVVSIYQGDEADTNFNKLEKIVARVENADSGAEIHRLTVKGGKLAEATAVKIAEIHRDGVEWHFTPGGEPIKGGLAEAARSYGILISSTT